MASWKIRLVTLTAIPVLAFCNGGPSSTEADEAAREACQKFRDLVETTESEVLESEVYHSRVKDIRDTGRASKVESLSEAAANLEVREGMTIKQAQERFADFEEECESLRL